MFEQLERPLTGRISGEQIPEKTKEIKESEEKPYIEELMELTKESKMFNQSIPKKMINEIINNKLIETWDKESLDACRKKAQNIDTIDLCNHPKKSIEYFLQNEAISLLAENAENTGTQYYFLKRAGKLDEAENLFKKASIEGKREITVFEGLIRGTTGGLIQVDKEHCKVSQFEKDIQEVRKLLENITGPLDELTKKEIDKYSEALKDYFKQKNKEEIRDKVKEEKKE